MATGSRLINPGTGKTIWDIKNQAETIVGMAVGAVLHTHISALIPAQDHM
jgi:hypothetical protein